MLYLPVNTIETIKKHFCFIKCDVLLAFFFISFLMKINILNTFLKVYNFCFKLDEG